MAGRREIDVSARVARVVLWTLVVSGMLLVVLMAWHPWVHPWFGVPRA